MALLRCMRPASRLHGSNKVASLTRATTRVFRYLANEHCAPELRCSAPKSASERLRCDHFVDHVCIQEILPPEDK